MQSTFTKITERRTERTDGRKNTVDFSLIGSDVTLMHLRDPVTRLRRSPQRRFLQDLPEEEFQKLSEEEQNAQMGSRTGLDDRRGWGSFLFQLYRSSR